MAPEPPDRIRPAPASQGVGRWLRSLTGVSEDILDWAPEERSSYTLLGAIVLNTGVLAGLSLIVALSSLTNGWWILLVPFGVPQALTQDWGAVGGLPLWAWAFSAVFPLVVTVTMIVMVLFGGKGTVWGPVLGAVALFVIQEIVWARYPYVHPLLFGAIIVAVVLLMPRGILGLLQLRYRLPRTI